MADATGSALGALGGTSTVTAFVEVQQGLKVEVEQDLPL